MVAASAPEDPVARAAREVRAAAWYWDVAADRNVFSREWKAMLGYAEHELGDSASEWRQRVHADDLERVMAHARAALAPGAPPYEDEFRLCHRDGSWRRIQSRGFVVEHDASGRGLRMVGVDHDLGAEQVLQDHVLQRDAIIALAERVGGLGWWTWEMATDTVTWSPGTYKAFGIDPSHPAPSFAQQAPLYTPESYERLVHAAKDAITSGQSYLLEVEIIQPRGARRSGILVGEVVRDADGRPLAMRGVMNDVTELLLVQRGAREQAQLLAQVSRIARIGGWSLDVISNMLSWTDATYIVHDLEPGEPIDVSRAIAFYHPDSRPVLQEAVNIAVERGLGFDIEARLVTAKGRTIWVRVRGQAERVGGRTVRIAGTFQDVTVAREAQAQLAQAMEDLRARNRELRDFAVAASHDLQEPLRKIQTFASLLSERFGNELHTQALDWLARMDSAAARMSALVADVLAYSRIAQHARTDTMCDLGEIVTGVLADLEVAIAQVGARVEVGPLPVLFGDPTQMRQLLQNLLGNALKYRHPERPPLIRLSSARVELPMVGSEASAPHWRVQVADNGIGFEPRFSEHIFGAYKRLHERSAYGGTGMGLAIVRRIAERHGGRAHAEGTPGVGATFTIDLPLEGPQPEPRHLRDYRDA